jgi:hypothetical protein
VQNAARVVDLVTGVVRLRAQHREQQRPRLQLRRHAGDRHRLPRARDRLRERDLLSNANQAVSCEIGAASPADDRAAMCSTTFGDDLVVLDTDATPGLEAFQLSGPLDEGDRCRTIAVSDGRARTAVAVSIFSDSATIIDTATGTVSGSRRWGSGPAAWRSRPTARRRWSRTSTRPSRA